MIQKATTFIASELNAYIRKRNQFSSNERTVIISNLVNPDGSVALKEENKIVLSLVNLQKETVVNLPANVAKDVHARTAAPQYYNLFILFSAYFKENLAEEGMRYLSQVLTFFQSNPYSDRSTAPSIPPEIHKLTYEFYTLNFSDLSNMWGALGAKYLPSALFKVGLVVVQEGLVRELTPAVQNPAAEVNKERAIQG